MSYEDQQRKISQTTEREAGRFLFSNYNPSDKGSSAFMDMRTRIHSERSAKMLLFYSVIGNQLGCDAGKEIKDAIERLLVSRKGLGREEGVEVLRSNFTPKVRIIEGGAEENLNATQ